MIAEELGLVGVSLVLGAFMLLCLRILSIMRISRDAFAAYVACGILATFFVQALIHIGVNLAIVPATGITLPLVSYGGSSLVIMLLMLGVVQSIAIRLNPADRL